MELNEHYKIEFLPVALHDMTEIVSSFVMMGSKDGAVRIKEKMNSAALQISEFPYSGVVVPDERLAKQGYRMLAVEKYLMFYRVFDAEQRVVFYRIINGTRNYPTLLNRLSDEI